jgi:hypothetical protein
MRLALDMAKMARQELCRAAIDGMQDLIKKPHAKVQEVNEQGVEFPGQQKVKTTIERNLAIHHQNNRARCLPS